MKKIYKIGLCQSCPLSEKRLNLDLSTCLEYKYEIFCTKTLNVSYLKQGFEQSGGMAGDGYFKKFPENPVIPDYCPLETYEKK